MTREKFRMLSNHVKVIAALQLAKQGFEQQQMLPPLSSWALSWHDKPEG